MGCVLPLPLFDLAERVFLVLTQVRVLRHDPLDQDRQHERPLVLEAPQLVERRVADLKWRGKSMYRGENKGLFVLLSRTQAGAGRTVKQQQE